MVDTIFTTTPDGTTSANQYYNSYDRVVVSGTLTDATLTETTSGVSGIIEVQTAVALL
ncbi:hypothetical protein [Acetobacter sp. AAB5]|uniref:hypothetical protein n=1 Tax=Acetobacter sp. AAB5 TaxID=3418370 RepID=UPI003CF3BF3D